MQQVWFITGTSSGIGKILAEQLADAGYHIISTARNQQNIAYLEAQYPENVLTLSLDITKPAQIENAVQSGLEKFGKIDVLVNNAGYGLEGAIEELRMQAIEDQMNTNFIGLVALTKQIIPVMREQTNGYIFNIASLAGLRGYRGMSAYCASKFAVVGFTESIAQELAPFGIKVSVIEPGPYRTDWAGRSLQKSDAIISKNPDSPYLSLNELLESQISGNSGKQPGNPVQIAKVLISAAKMPSLPLHMIFGDEAIAIWKDKLKRYESPEFFDYFPHDRFSF